MADFARLACAAAPTFGWTADEMQAAIEGNRADAVEAVIEAEPLAVAVRAFMEEQRGRTWEGVATALLAIVNERVPEEQKRERGYPKDAARLSAKLRRLTPALRRGGWDIALPTGGGRDGRTIRIRHVPAGQRQQTAAPDPDADDAGGYL
jgi:hypothetical protein